jgi:hypothetical protein
MAIKYELSAVTGSYTNKSGEEKKSYVRCGVIMETKKGGLVAKLEALPVNFDGWIFMNEPKPREHSGDDTGQKPAGANRFSDMKDDDPGADIPFVSCSLGDDVIYRKLRWGVE